jgi:hypothetical protein
MDRSETESLIEQKISQAKLDLAEKRLQTVTWLAGGLLALFGVIIPLWFASHSSEKVDSAITEMKRDFVGLSNSLFDQSKSQTERIDKSIDALRLELKGNADNQTRESKSATDRVDRAIGDMQTQFKELAGVQLRHPLLVCLVGGRSLEAAVLSLQGQIADIRLELRNEGDAPARNVRIRLYVATEQNVQLGGEVVNWQQLTFSDEPTYGIVFETYLPYASIDPKESRPLGFSLMVESMRGKSFPALLKIYYEQPEPKKYAFTISIGS